MKKEIIIISFIVTVLLSNCFSQTKLVDAKYDIRDFYVVDFTNYDNITGILIRPDSLKEHPTYSKNRLEMYNYLEYFIHHYSNLTYEYEQYLETLLPNKNKIKLDFERNLVEDTLLNKLLLNTINITQRVKIPIDSIQKILSRFYYLHRYEAGVRKGELTFHICIGKNGALKLPQNEYTPYFNAFCWSIVRTNDKIWDVIKPEMIMPSDIEKSISNVELKHFVNKNYNNIIKNNIVREIVVAEYENKKDFLNFEIVY